MTADLCNQRPERAVWEKGVETMAEKKVHAGNTRQTELFTPGVVCLSLGQALRIPRPIPWPALSPSLPLPLCPACAPCVWMKAVSSQLPVIPAANYTFPTIMDSISLGPEVKTTLSSLCCVRPWNLSQQKTSNTQGSL